MSDLDYCERCDRMYPSTETDHDNRCWYDDNHELLAGMAATIASGLAAYRGKLMRESLPAEAKYTLDLAAEIVLELERRGL